MSFRPLSNRSGASVAEVFFDALGHEILSEKAAALGRAGARVELCLVRLRQYDDDFDAAAAGAPAAETCPMPRRQLVREAAEAVYAWFIQRELCGFRRHDSVIRDLQIPREVLARLGAK
jgi:hypothetical protein